MNSTPHVVDIGSADKDDTTQALKQTAVESAPLPAFRLSPLETAETGVQRIIQHQINDMYHNLAQRDSDPDAIHQVRVGTKRLRALAGLLKHCSPFLAADLRRSARQISAHLSAHRDYEVLLETTRQLTAGNRKKGQALFDEAIQSLPACPDELDEEALAVVEQELQFLQLAALNLTSADMTRDALLARYEHNYTRLKKQWRKASLKTPEEQWHELRKREKACLYQSQLLKLVLPGMKAKTIRRMKSLGQQLGDYHDLSMLYAHLQADEERQHKKLQRLIRKQQKRLLKTILARTKKWLH